MSLPPTNKPLTAKPFTQVKTAYCGWCPLSCGMLAYLEEDGLVDLYGHPADAEGLGSLCSKGIAYNQQLPQSPLRIKTPLLREGKSFRKLSEEEAEKLLEEALSKKTAVFLDKYFTLEDYALAKSLGEVYGETPYLPFRPSDLPPRDWRNKKALLNLGAEPTFSLVTLTRFLVDAVEKGAYLFSFGSRFTSTFQKSSRYLLAKPHEAVEAFISALKGEGKAGRLLKELGEEVLLLVGETFLLSPFKGVLLKALREARKEFGASYALVGNFSPFPLKGIKEFKEELEDYETLLLFGNPLRYFSEEELKKLEGKTLVNVAYFPTLTAQKSDILIPRKAQGERAFTNRGVGFLAFSPPFLKSPFKDLLGEPPSEAVEKLLRELGAKGGESLPQKTPLSLPDLTEVPLEEGELLRSSLWLWTEELLTEELGRWLPWTYPLEPKQVAYAHPRSAKLFKDFPVPIKEDPNNAEGVLLVSSAFEEYQPFSPGVRAGVLSPEPYHRLVPLELQ